MDRSRISTLREAEIRLEEGENYTIRHFDPELHRSAEPGTFQLDGKDGFGGVWGFRGLHAEKYFVYFTYVVRENLPSRAVPFGRVKLKQNPLQ
jgi:hypothetical protein